MTIREHAKNLQVSCRVGENNAVQQLGCHPVNLVLKKKKSMRHMDADRAGFLFQNLVKRVYSCSYLSATLPLHAQPLQ